MELCRAGQNVTRPAALICRACRTSKIPRVERAFSTTCSQRQDSQQRPDANVPNRDDLLSSLLQSARQPSSEPGDSRQHERVLSGFAPNRYSPGKLSEQVRSQSGKSTDEWLQSQTTRARINPRGHDNNKPIPQQEMKLNASTGKTVRVDPSRGMDVGRAFRSLDMLCNKNKVRADFMKQRFHERPGLKRKRLAYEGKIRNFRVKFSAVVKMVQGMAKSGW